MSQRERSPRRGFNEADVVKQIEYYLSDGNLKGDKFFHEKISSSAEGWIPMADIMNCNNIKKMKVTAEDCAKALEKSAKVEVHKAEGGEYEIRRSPPEHKKLPALVTAPKKNPKVHDGGIVIQVLEVPECVPFMDVKTAFTKKLAAAAEGKKVWNVSTRTDEGLMIVVIEPFEQHVEFWESSSEIEVTVSKAPEKEGVKSTQKPEDVGKTFTLKYEVCYGTALTKALKRVPPMLASRRDQMSIRMRKQAQKPIEVAEMVFDSVKELKQRVREVMASRSNGEYLKEDGGDFKLVKFLIENYHPSKDKSKGMVKLLVDVSTMDTASRCFHMERADGSREDVSIIKCLTQLEANPPFKK
jgi:hypothetical protein